MAKMDDAADAVMGLAERLRGIFDLADVVKGLGSIENATAERKAALVTATTEHEAKLAEIETAKGEMADYAAWKASDLEKHKVAAVGLVDDATKEAAEIRTRAHVEADSVANRAAAEVQDIQAAHAKTMAGKTAELETARASLAEIQKAVDSAKAELAAVQQKSEAMKQAARSMLSPPVTA